MKTYHNGWTDSIFGKLRWIFTDENNLTLRSVRDDTVDINGILYKFVCFLSRQGEVWSYQHGQTSLTRALESRDPTVAAYLALTKEAERLAAQIASPDNLQEAKISAVRNTITDLEDEITEHTDAIADLMKQRARQTLQLQMLLQKRGRLSLPCLDATEG